MTALLLALAVTVSAPVTVRILESHHPHALRVGKSEVVAEGDWVVVDGRRRRSFEKPPGHWTLAGKDFRRTYDGALTFTAEGGELTVALRAPLESYVAGVVAAESAGGEPRAALEALAVVARSYALVPRAEPLCDSAFCQLFRGVVSGEHGDEARAAAEATTGLVLRLADGSIAEAPFHAACGGRTADPREVFGKAERTGARSVPDLDEAAGWTVRLGEKAWHAAVRAAFGDPLLIDDPRLIYGAGGWLVQLALSDGRLASGDAFVRALDRGQGRGVVRSARFRVERRGGDRLLSGRGHGHGVGLCQAGAALRAKRGDGFESILAAYFPSAALEPLGTIRRALPPSGTR